jgi:hypothetical protein
MRQGFSSLPRPSFLTTILVRFLSESLVGNLRHTNAMMQKGRKENKPINRAIRFERQLVFHTICIGLLITSRNKSADGVGRSGSCGVNC